MESSHFRPSVLHVALYKTLFLDFLFRPPNAQNLLPKICTKSPKSACRADRPQMFGLTMGFSGMADSIEPCKMLWGRPLLPWQRNLGKFWLFLHKLAYTSACMADRPDMFGPTRGADQGTDPCCHGAYRLVHPASPCVQPKHCWHNMQGRLSLPTDGDKCAMVNLGGMNKKV